MPCTLHNQLITIVPEDKLQEQEEVYTDCDFEGCYKLVRSTIDIVCDCQRDDLRYWSTALIFTATDCLVEALLCNTSSRQVNKHTRKSTEGPQIVDPRRDEIVSA